MLRPWAPDVWTDEREAKFFGVETGTRMTVVRLTSGGLFILSPVKLDDETRRAIDALGEVRAVVAPSLFHHLSVAEWMAAYPKAFFGACPGLEWKRTDLAFSSVVADEPHPIYKGDLEQVYFSARRENELDFFHAPSKTLIVTDALLNLSTHARKSTRFIAKLMQNSAPGLGWMEPLMVRDRKLARRQVDRMLEWDFDRVILAHGQMVEGGGRRVLEHAYAWL
ncbi:MAG: DUF4336 domain-containing protein [Polyangiaceae bacterium]|nr:DUF4336 domain-containing protein [Polyangiaceae bacterium]